MLEITYNASEQRGYGWFDLTGCSGFKQTLLKCLKSCFRVCVEQGGWSQTALTCMIWSLLLTSAASDLSTECCGWHRIFFTTVFWRDNITEGLESVENNSQLRSLDGSHVHLSCSQWVRRIWSANETLKYSVSQHLNGFDTLSLNEKSCWKQWPYQMLHYGSVEN